MLCLSGATGKARRVLIANPPLLECFFGVLDKIETSEQHQFQVCNWKRWISIKKLKASFLVKNKILFSWIRNSRIRMGQVGQFLNLSWYFYACRGKVKKKTNLVVVLLSRILTAENLPKFGQTVLLNTVKLQLRRDSASCVPSSVPSYCRVGNVGWVLSPPRTSLCSPEMCALGVKVAAGFAFGGIGAIGVKKMEWRARRSLRGWKWN